MPEGTSILMISPFCRLISSNTRCTQGDTLRESPMPKIASMIMVWLPLYLLAMKSSKPLAGLLLRGWKCLSLACRKSSEVSGWDTEVISTVLSCLRSSKFLVKSSEWISLKGTRVTLTFLPAWESIRAKASPSPPLLPTPA